MKHLWDGRSIAASIHKHKLIQIQDGMAEIDKRRSLGRVEAGGQRGGEAAALGVGGRRVDQGGLSCEELHTAFNLICVGLAAQREAVGALNELRRIIAIVD